MLCTLAAGPFAATRGDTTPARTGTASLTGASGRVTTGGEAVSTGTWADAAALRTGAVAGIASGPSGMGTNAGAGGRGGAACCGDGGYGGDVS